MSFARLWSDVKCAAGATDLGSLADAVDLRYRIARDGTGDCSFALKSDAAIAASVRTGRVVRIVDDAGAVHQYRILTQTPARTAPTFPVRARNLLYDLADVPCFQTVNGIVNYRFSATKTPQGWIDDVVIPCLTAKGRSWIARGTITPTFPATLTFENQTLLWLVQQLCVQSVYVPSLRWYASGGTDAGYYLDVTDLGASAATPRLWVGQNVQVYERHIDREQQATAIIPRGKTPSGASDPGDIGEYAMRVVTAPAAGSAVTVEDPDGNLDPLRFDDQEAGFYLEKLMVPKPVSLVDIYHDKPWSAETVETPKHVCYDSTQKRLYVTASGTAKVYYYNAETLAVVGTITVGTTPTGCAYDVTQNKVYVANFGGDSVTVINAATAAVSSTISLGAGTGPRFIARAGNGKMYVTCETSGQVKEIDPSTDTVTATLTCAGAYDIVYTSTSDRLVVTSTSGSNVFFINPATPSVASTVSLTSGTSKGVAWSSSQNKAYVSRPGSNDVKVLDCASPAVSATITGFTSPQYLFEDATENRIYVQHNTDKLGIVNPATNALLESVFFGPGQEHPGAALTAQGIVFIPAYVSGGLGWLQVFCPATKGVAVRRAITATDPDTQSLTIGTVLPFYVDDLVSVRTDAAGGWRSELAVPAGVTLDKYRAAFFTRSDLRAERNYVLNPWLRDAQTVWFAPYWDRTQGGGESALGGFRRTTPDVSTWTTFNATLDGFHAAGSTSFALKDMTVGDVLLPGDFIQYVSSHVPNRYVVDGAGKVTVALVKATIADAADGTTIVIRRLNQRDIPCSIPDVCGVLYHSAMVGVHTNRCGVWFVVPYVAGRTTLKITVRFTLWSTNGVVPSTDLLLRVETLTGGAVGTTTPTDATNYSDGLGHDMTLTYTHTLTNTQALRVWLEGTNANNRSWAAFITDVQAVLGPEGPITPAFEVNASYGELYAAGNLELAARYQPQIAYKLAARDDTPSAPFTVGAYTDFRDPDYDITATPRILAVTRRVRNRAQEDDAPEIEVDNREQTFVRRLVKAGAL